MYWKYLCCIFALHSTFSLVFYCNKQPNHSICYFSLSILPFPREPFAFQKEFGWGSLLAVRSHEPGRYSWSSASLPAFIWLPVLCLERSLLMERQTLIICTKKQGLFKINLGGSYTCFVLRGIQNTFMGRCDACKLKFGVSSNSGIFMLHKSVGNYSLSTLS